MVPLKGTDSVVVVPTGKTAETKACTTFVTVSCPATLTVSAVIGAPEFGVNIVPLVPVGTTPAFPAGTSNTTKTRRLAPVTPPICVDRDRSECGIGARRRSNRCSLIGEHHTSRRRARFDIAPYPAADDLCECRRAHPESQRPQSKSCTQGADDAQKTSLKKARHRACIQWVLGLTPSPYPRLKPSTCMPLSFAVGVLHF
jgi:hypothetical protein